MYVYKTQSQTHRSYDNLHEMMAESPAAKVEIMLPGNPELGAKWQTLCQLVFRFSAWESPDPTAHLRIPEEYPVALHPRLLEWLPIQYLSLQPMTFAHPFFHNRSSPGIKSTHTSPPQIHMYKLRWPQRAMLLKIL